MFINTRARLIAATAVQYRGTHSRYIVSRRTGGDIQIGPHRTDDFFLLFELFLPFILSLSLLSARVY